MFIVYPLSFRVDQLHLISFPSQKGGDIAQSQREVAIHGFLIGAIHIQVWRINQHHIHLERPPQLNRFQYIQEVGRFETGSTVKQFSCKFIK